MSLCLLWQLLVPDWVIASGSRENGRRLHVQWALLFCYPSDNGPGLHTSVKWLDHFSVIREAERERWRERDISPGASPSLLLSHCEKPRWSRFTLLPKVCRLCTPEMYLCLPLGLNTCLSKWTTLMCDAYNFLGYFKYLFLFICPSSHYLNRYLS